MQSVAEILNLVKEGKLSTKKAEALLKLDALVVIDEIAKLDYNRFTRRGVPEIIYAEAKSVAQITAIVKVLARKLSREKARQEPAIISKVRKDQVDPVKRAIGEFSALQLHYFPEARIMAFNRKDAAKNRKNKGRVALIAAGTSDIPALNESEVLLHLLGCQTIRFNDVGV